MSDQFRFVVSETVTSIMMLDDLEPNNPNGRGAAYGIHLADKQPRRGTAVEGTREGLRTFAQYLIDVPRTCDDAPPRAQRACVDAGHSLRAMLLTDSEIHAFAERMKDSEVIVRLCKLALDDGVVHLPAARLREHRERLAQVMYATKDPS